jgi:hypothetical protein
VCVAWEGQTFEDSTGAAARLVEYKHFLITETTEVPISVARTYPDSIRRYYAPRGWPGWTSERASATGALLEGLVPNHEYLFVITCFDNAGNYDPLFSLNKNMIYMRVVEAAAAGLPQITVFNEFFLHSEHFGRFDPSRVIDVDVPAGQKITFNWSALPATDSRGNLVGGPIVGYRWGLDLDDVNDHRQGDDAGHSGHWTRWSLQNTSTTVGPFNGGETHHLHVEANGEFCDPDAGRFALVSLRLNAVQPSFNRDLLIVDDTRYMLDRIQSGTICSAPANRPSGLWPTQAELDTFLYARGGMPWKCYPPVGGQPQLSTPGIFNGYRFDTLGTNLRVVDLTIPLTTLSQYRHVIWITDGMAALNNRPGSDTGDIAGPTTAMRYMTGVGRQNTLAAYVAQGGKVWLAGGGAATASMINFNRAINDNSLPIPRTLTFRFTDNELIPGRFMYDQAHWRSEFKQYRVNNVRIRRYLGRLESNPGVYGSLLPEIRLKTPATDPFPPNRAVVLSSFYQSNFDIEFLSAANEILEDVDPRPPHVSFESTLDSVFKATASTLRPDTGPDGIQSVTMTVYHGADNAQFVMTGFNLWNYRRADCIALVDFVLQQLWGLNLTVPAPAVIEAGSVGAPQPVGRHMRPRDGRASAGAAGEARRPREAPSHALGRGEARRD